MSKDLQEIMMNASDFVFCVDRTQIEHGENASFCLTSKTYWDENECLNDGGDDNDIEKFLPPKFHNIAEAAWEYSGGTWEEGKQKLLDAGFVHLDALDDFINNYESRLASFQRGEED